MAPKETDLDTEGRSYEMPAPWSEWIEEHAINIDFNEEFICFVRFKGVWNWYVSFKEL